MPWIGLVTKSVNYAVAWTQLFYSRLSIAKRDDSNYGKPPNNACALLVWLSKGFQCAFGICFLTASKYCGSGLKKDLIVVLVVVVLVLVISLLSNLSAFDRFVGWWNIFTSLQIEFTWLKIFIFVRKIFLHCHEIEIVT